MRASLLLLSLIGLVAAIIGVDLVYSRTHGIAITCRVDSITQESRDTTLVAWLCDGDMSEIAPMGGPSLRQFPKVGDTVRCTKWRPKILGPLTGDIVQECHPIAPSIES